MLAIPDEADRPQIGSSYLVTVHGADRLGIVARLASTIAAAGGNITDLTTRLAGELYVLLAEVDLPPGSRRVGAAGRPGPGVRRARGRHHPAAGGERRAVSLPLPTLPVGRVLEVVRAPHPVLSAPGPAVDPADPRVVQLCADLVATMRVSPGCVGLAAPQLGVAGQAFCVDVSSHPKTRTSHGLIVLLNAEVVEASRQDKGREGCMSVPDLTGDVKRASRITVRGQLPGTGEPVVISTDAFEARALQHEIDHCAGLLFLDRVSGAHAIYSRKVYLDPAATPPSPGR